MKRVFITGRGMATPAGFGLEANWRRLAEGVPALTLVDGRGPIGLLEARSQKSLEVLGEERAWRASDPAVRLGVLASRQAASEAELDGAEAMGVVMGSSRGATHLIEQEFEGFLHTREVGVRTSPETTSGAFAAAVARDRRAFGPAFFVSAACATGLHAVGTGFSLIRSGVCSGAYCGGSESSLTEFTMAQLRSARVLAKSPSVLFPCRPMHPGRSGMIPGEGSACVVLESGEPGPRALAEVAGYGAAGEPTTATGIREDGAALQMAIRGALDMAGLSAASVDLVVGHGAGTVKGDAAELQAYRSVFGEPGPGLTFHKWMTGHMIGASAAFSVAMATRHMETGEVFPLPYFDEGAPFADTLTEPPRVTLVTALGFGGNAAALVLVSPQ